jgi:hypothetical protein
LINDHSIYQLSYILENHLQSLTLLCNLYPKLETTTTPAILQTIKTLDEFYNKKELPVTYKWSFPLQHIQNSSTSASFKNYYSILEQLYPQEADITLMSTEEQLLANSEAKEVNINSKAKPPPMMTTTAFAEDLDLVALSNLIRQHIWR